MTGRGAWLAGLGVLACSFVALWHALPGPAAPWPVFGLLPPLIQPAGPARVDLRGPAGVTDADSLLVDGRAVRLEGLDAPEARQTCTRQGAAWPCGQDASAALRLFIGPREVACEARGEDRFGRTLGRCWAGREEINAWLVREGWAVAYTRYSWRYLPQQVLAWWEGRGLWQGSFEAPEDWRRAQQR